MAEKYVLGVGAANVDIHGRSRDKINMRDSNPGELHISAGGVTRNVCENLARMGATVKLISAVGPDLFGERILRDCAAAGVDTSRVYRDAQHYSSCYVSILDERGDMLVALSDMSVLGCLPERYLEENRDALDGAQLITCDPSLPPEQMELLLDLAKTPVYVDPVSTAYARTIKDIVGRFHTVKPNLMEAEILSGLRITDRRTLEKACDSLLAKGLRRVIVSLGGDGCFYMDDAGTALRRKLSPLEKVVNATGGGDAFMAAVICATLDGREPCETADFALAAGGAAVSSDCTINPMMSRGLLMDYLKRHPPVAPDGDV